MTQVNLRDIVYAVRKKRLDPTKTITIADMFKASIFKKCEYGVKLLGKGIDEYKELGLSMNFEVSDASENVIEAVKELGGKIKVVYNTPLTL